MRISSAAVLCACGARRARAQARRRRLRSSRRASAERRRRWPCARAIGDAMRRRRRATSRAGDKVGGARGARFAAGKGNPMALWKLGRMYASGDGVPADDSRPSATSPGSPTSTPTTAPDGLEARVVANAFVALGELLPDGIPEAGNVQAEPGARHQADPARRVLLRRRRRAVQGRASSTSTGTELERGPHPGARAGCILAAGKGHAAGAGAARAHLLFNGKAADPAPAASRA